MSLTNHCKEKNIHRLFAASPTGEMPLKSLSTEKNLSIIFKVSLQGPRGLALGFQSIHSSYFENGGGIVASNEKVFRLCKVNQIKRFTLNLEKNNQIQFGIQTERRCLCRLLLNRHSKIQKQYIANRFSPKQAAFGGKKSQTSCK